MVVYKRANRQYVAMSRKEVWAFLESQNKVFVGLPMEDGFPHVSPIWFCILGEKIYLRTHDYKTKARLAKAGRACLAADDGYLYRELRGVIVWGTCRVVTDQKLLDRVGAALDKKYEKQQWKPAQMPKPWVEERRKEKRAFIEVTPLKVDSWDNSKV